jgi:excisionase family DNA binding protein
MRTNGEPQLVSVNQAAEMLNLRPGTIRSWYRAGKLSRVRVGKKAIRILASEVRRIISDGFAPARKPHAGQTDG